MKLSTRDAVGVFQKPDPRRAGILIYGPDSMRVALKREAYLEALLGPDAEQDMRLSRMRGADLRKDPAQLVDALKAVGFFPGQRAVFVEEAADGTTQAIKAAFQEWREGDAVLVVTAGQLAARSSLRKLFEGHTNAYAAAIYPDPPSRAEIEAVLAKAGLTDIGSDAMRDLGDLARILDPGDFAQTVEKLALYKLSDPAPLSGQDIADCAPVTTEAVLDDAIDHVAEGRVTEIGPIMQKLDGQGVQPVGICIGAVRHFRALHLAACHPKGTDAGLSAIRPPVFGPRRNRMARQAGAIGMHRLEEVLGILMDTDLGLRSSRPVPARAMLERNLIRIAMLVGRQSSR